MTYDQLVAAVLGYFGNAGDPDPNFAAYMPTIVEMAESKIYTVLRHPRMIRSDFVKSLSDTQSPPFLVPDRMLEAARVTDATPWYYQSPEQFFKLKEPTDFQMWTIYGDEIVLSQDVTDTVVFAWYDKPEPLAEADQSAIFQLYPQLFLYGSLAEAARYLREPESVIANLDGTFQGTLNQVRLEGWNASLPLGQTPAAV